MALTCNIDARGKRARFISGVLQLGAAIGVGAIWAWPSGSRVAWVIAAALVIGGAFTVFEARAGWCVLRAMGIKTRI